MAEKAQRLLTPDELDAIGEIMNISMGSAATAVSTMLEKQVTITTPQLEQEHFRNIDSSDLEPALNVKIKYIEGILGTNVIMLRRHDVQIILELLMGGDGDTNQDDFEFDDMSMSAACEVMNQMMGASSTALSEILNIPINISTPEAVLSESKDDIQSTFFDFDDDDSVVAISFKMMIKDVLDTTFTCFLSTELASRIVSQVTEVVEAEEPDPLPPPEMEPSVMVAVPAAPQQSQPGAFSEPSYTQTQPMPQATQQQMPQAYNDPPAQQQVQPPMQQQVQSQVQPQVQPSTQQQAFQAPAPQSYQPQSFGQEAPRQPAQFSPMPDAAQQAQPQNPYGMPGYGQQYPPQYPQQQYPPYGQNPYGYSQAGYYQQQAPLNLKSAEFPDFSRQPGRAAAPASSNMNLLMGVQLDVSVIIGRAKRKIKEIMDFGQGTVIELDKQTGAPAEIMVNGQLLAYGDVIVVGDNFGIRITEIVGTKDLLDSLDPSK